MAKKGGATPAKRIGGRPPPAEVATSDELRENVLVEQFRRELLVVLQPALEENSSPGESKEEVAWYGPITEKLVQIGGRLERLAEDQMSLIDKMELLVEVGDKLYRAQEYHTASVFFYEKVLQLLGIQPGRRPDPDTRDLAFANYRSGQIYVRSAYGAALCTVQTECRRDPYVRHAGTMERLVSALAMVQQGMETAVRLEKKHSGQFAWLILNGSLAVFSSAKPMVDLGFATEVVGFLKWCLVALESVVVLSTIKFILWKLQICATICDCYEAMALKESLHRDRHVNSALACAEHALSIVQRLRKEEELDLPLPTDVQIVLDRAQTTAFMLVVRAKSGTSQGSQLKASIEAKFLKPAEKIRAAVDAMEKITRIETNLNNARLYLSPYPREQEGPMKELLSVITDAIRPRLEELSSIRDHDASAAVAEADSTSELELRAIFPLAFHISTVRFCYCLGEPCAQEFRLLLSSIRKRVGCYAQQDVPEEDSTAIACLVSVFEALDGMRQSLRCAESSDGSENTRPKKECPIKTPNEMILPSKSSVHALVNALKTCVLSHCDEFCLLNRDMLIAAALTLWRDAASPLLEVLESSDARELSGQVVLLLTASLEAIHLMFTAVDFEDLLLHGQIGISLGALLLTTKRPRVAVTIVHRILERINDYRDTLALQQSFSADAMAPSNTKSYHRSLSAATLSFNMFSSPVADEGSSQPAGGDSKTNSEDVGVPGTGAQFGRLHQDLCCVQVDLVLLLYRAELQDATITNMLSPLVLNPEHSNKRDDGPNKYLQETTSRLISHCRQNGYMKTLLSIQRLFHPLTSTEERLKIAGDCLKTLKRIEANEGDLQRRAARSLTPTDSKSGSQSTTVPPAPIVLSRSSSAVTIQIIEFIPALPVQRKRQVHFYMVYAKLAGAGTAVSLNNNSLPGTAAPIYFDSDMTTTISGLASNENYVFAVAAFDDRCELIQGIGETSEPVTTLNPLPLPLCYGYLAQACHELQLTEHAKKAASYLYDLVVSAAYAHRPTWRANPFYRQALRRDIVSRLPVPILGKCAAAMEILCQDEAGDPELDGMLIARDPDANSLFDDHVSILESARRISIGVEIASASGNQELVSQLCFKGYRVLLPLLHLASGCDGKAYPPLITFLQGLDTVEYDRWGLDTRNLAARLAFELFRIATQQDDREMLAATLPLLAQKLVDLTASPGVELPSPELLGLDEALALHQLAKTAKSESLATNETPREQPMSAPPGKTAPSATKTSGTPSQTPRSDDGAPDVAALPSVRELLDSVDFDPSKALTLVKTYAHSDKRAIEAFCKIAGATLDRTDLNDLECLFSTIKITGDFSSDFRALIAAIGGTSLLPDAALQPVDPAQQVSGILGSARSQSNTEKVESKDHTSDFPADTTAPASPDDMYLYHWCGELFFLKATITARKIEELRYQTPAADINHGPITEDNIYSLLRGDATKDTPPASARLDVQATSARVETSAAPVELDTTTPSEPPYQDRALALFELLLEQISSSCQLFHRGKSWQSLQAAAQRLWNSILVAWIPPSEIAVSESRLVRLESCVNVLFDMVELSTTAKSCELLLGNTLSSGQVADEQAVVSTTIVTSAMGKLGVKNVWLAELVTYCVQAFASARDWERIVRMGERYYNCCGTTREGSRFAELNFPVLVHAQTEILKRQDRALVAAQAERQAFAAAFHEQEARRKKKKSRLVVEEIATPEELAFRARDAEMMENIQILAQTRDHERAELQHLTRIHEDLQKSRNKCQQALDRCSELVSTYRRYTQSQLVNGSAPSTEEISALRRQATSAFSRCIASCRQKRQKRLTCQALLELGDFHLACGNMSDAVKHWHEVLDNAYSTLRVIDTWRQVISSDLGDDTSINGVVDADLIEGDELWIALQCCSALGKIILQKGSVDAYQAAECALMAAAIFTRLYACAMPHPTKPFLYGSYSVAGQIWPGRDLLLDSESVSAFAIMLALVCSQEMLLQYEAEHAVVSMPVVAGYEYLGSNCLDDKPHVANALRLRITALTYAGRFQEAFALIPKLFFDSSVLAAAGSESVPIFHGNKRLQDPENAAAMSWLSMINVPKLAEDLRERCHFHEPLIRQIVMALLRLVVALAILQSHPDAQARTLRSSAQTMAKDVLEFFIAHDSKHGDEQAQNEQEFETPVSQGDSWDVFELHQLRCDAILHQCRLLFASGQWKAAAELSERAAAEFAAADTRLKHPIAEIIRTSMDHELKYSPVSQLASLMAKCRRLGIACHIARGDMHAAIALADKGIREVQQAGEQLLYHELELKRAQALVCLGRCEEAGDALTSLAAIMAERHTANRSALYAQVLHSLAAVERAKAAFSVNTELLRDVCSHLAAAKLQLDRHLCSEGWVGVPNTPDNGVDAADRRIRDKFLNLYYPALPAFVQVSLDLAQAIAECPAGSNAGQDSCENTGSLLQGEQVLTLVSNALFVLDEIPLPRHMSVTKAQLLLLQGATLKKKLLSKLAASVSTVELQEELRALFAECTNTLQLSIRVCIADAGHDRSLLRRALVELTDLYMLGCFQADKDEHVRAAFHFLRLAVRVSQQESTLFDSVELQLASEALNTSGLAAEQQLPTYIVDAVCRVSVPTSLETSGETSIPAVSAVPVAAVPDTSKKAPAGANSAAVARAPASPFESSHVINYFVRTLREQNVFPTGNAILQETALRLHYFLAQAHSAYAKHCCLTELPPVPSLAPEIQPGLVCTHWGHDLTPGISFTAGTHSERTHVALFFTLGTTKIDMSESTDDADAAFERMERFVTAPLLSKRAGFPAAAIREVRAAISHLRVDMEDEQSLVIDRTAFPSRLRAILRRFQLVFRTRKPSREAEEDSAGSPDDEICDVFGNVIPLPPTLTVVRMLEALLTIGKALSATDNELCYFMRDLLD